MTSCACKYFLTQNAKHETTIRTQQKPRLGAPQQNVRGFVDYPYLIGAFRKDVGVKFLFDWLDKKLFAAVAEFPAGIARVSLAHNNTCPSVNNWVRSIR